MLEEAEENEKDWRALFITIHDTLEDRPRPRSNAPSGGSAESDPFDDRPRAAGGSSTAGGSSELYEDLDDLQVASGVDTVAQVQAPGLQVPGQLQDGAAMPPPPARPAKARKIAVPFSGEEDAALRRGVSVFGNDTCKWAKILHQHQHIFHITRTGGSLKDRWRNLQLQQEKDAT